MNRHRKIGLFLKTKSSLTHPSVLSIQAAARSDCFKMLSLVFINIGILKYCPGHLTQNNTLIYDRHGARSDILDCWTAGHWSPAKVSHYGYYKQTHKYILDLPLAKLNCQTALAP